MKPKRTICADCRWYRTEQNWARYPGEQHLCGHENARDFVTGKPSDCRSRNLGACLDYEAKKA